MLHTTRSLATRPLTTVSALALLWLASCGDAAAPVSQPGSSGPADGPSGTLTLALSAAADITGFSIEVKDRAGGVVFSEVLSAGADAAVQKLVSLAPGTYRVTSTPMLSPTEPAAACKPATRSVSIKSGKTSQVSLLSRCQSGDLGALGIEAGANFVPELTSVEVDPGTQLSACQPVTVAFSAIDADGGPLSCDASLDAAEPVTLEAVPGAEPGSVDCSVQLEPAAGDHVLLVRACDELDCDSLEIPLHVAAGSCSATCDDGNPCTEDQADAQGFCSSTPIPDGSLCAGGNLKVKVLGFNDFHGQLEKGRVVAGRPVGGAAVLAAYLKAAQSGIEDQTFIVHAGDHVGASPPASALLQDEPSIQFLNMLANDACTAEDRLNPACNLVGTVGNHEFDEGMVELLRLLSGGNFSSGPFLEDPYPGARFPYVSANVIERATGQPLLRPFVVKQTHGVKLGFIGAVLEQTPTIVTPTGVAGLDFIDEADAINTQAQALKELGVRAQIVTIHQGGFQTNYVGPTRPASMLTGGPEIQDIVSRLDDEIDVVISGHTHAFTNAFIPNANGTPILVVQAFSAGTAYDDVDLQIDPLSGDVVAKTAQVVTTFSDVAPGLTPDAAIAAVVQAASDRVAPLVNQVFGVASSALTRAQNVAGESQMGDLIADAQLAAQNSQFVFMNPGGIRADLNAGDITFGELFTIQPFGNTLVQMNMTGTQIKAVLEQQWQMASPRILQIAGFSYTWNPAAPVGSRVVEIRLGGMPIDPSATYTVTTNNFLATGGDGFTTFTAGTNQIGGPIDLDALIEYVTDTGTIGIPVGGRILTL
ncbi:MAG TPA: 5'-nucleotidase C-terminal domain-containing protein [Polyangiaceae bacterium]|nr:5'-nucleotidase C-terminal domain-containing protein [Polyangiaceae bacterium]